MSFHWQTPYQVKHARSVLFWERLQIIYDDTVIYEVLCGISRYKAEKKHFDIICAMLNGAYNLGAINERQIATHIKGFAK